jgi:hypothetical protein
MRYAPIWGHRTAYAPVEANAWGEQVHSAEHDLLAYLRLRDTRVERLPPEFVANLQRALTHYGVRSLEPSPVLDESLLLMYKSHQHVNQHLATINAMLERRLEHVDELAHLSTAEMHLVLNRLLQALQEQLAQVDDTQKAALQVKLNEVSATVRSEKVVEVASEFDHIHDVQRAQRVGSIDHVIAPGAIRPYLIEALERGIERELQRTGG